MFVIASHLCEAYGDVMLLQASSRRNFHDKFWKSLGYKLVILRV